MPGASTQDKQPQIPVKVAIAILKRGQRELWQRQWIRSSVYRLEHDYLSRIKVGVQRSPVFFTGPRQQQNILARLRFGHCGLAASDSRWCPFLSSVCACGFQQETVEHYLLYCPLHDALRARLIERVARVFKGPLTEELLLGCGVQILELKHRVLISDAVFKFVLSTGRDI